MKTYFIAGGAGFIGSHMAASINSRDPQARVVIFDNYSSGRTWHLDGIPDRSRVNVVKGDIKDMEQLTNAMKDADIVYHFASNPDISKAMAKPDIDFWEGTYLTSNILEAMRILGVKRLLYASGSGVYGDTGLAEIGEDHAPLLPISTYGASKLAGEALICSYCHMFGMQASAMRFANVVGPHQTHGVGYDFVRQLIGQERRLKILGDGKQSKSYIYITDVVKALELLEGRALPGYSYYNVATRDYVTVKEIADIAAESLGLAGVTYEYTGGDRGWKGDVPVVRFKTDKIRSLGWENAYSSKEALTMSIASIVSDAREKKFNW